MTTSIASTTLKENHKENYESKIKVNVDKVNVSYRNFIILYHVS